MRKAFAQRAASVLGALVFAGSSLGSLGCGAGAGAAGRGTERATAPGMAVTDAAFAGAVRDLLVSEPGTKERSMRLAGVEARQFARAVARFHAHSAERGVAAVTGGLYLIRLGEMRDGLLGPSAREALASAAKELANRGDEGRARALYDILLRVTPAPADRRELQTHLDALQAWVRDTTSKGGPVHTARELASIAIARRLLEPTDPALQEASQRTTQWVQAALALRNTLREKRMAPSRDEGIEAYAALQSGGRTLAALYLTGADAIGAVHAIDRAQAREFGAHDLIEALEEAADKPSAGSWLEVLHALRPGTSREAREEEDVFEDKELFHAAAWTVAMEAYRLDPTVPESAGAVAAGLQEYGMAEASPAVLVAAARAHPEARTLGGALAIVMRAMASEVEAEDVDAARRTYNAAAPLLTLVESAKMGQRVQPGPGSVRAMMGEIELREGRVAAARTLLQSASAAEKSGGVLATLARIERFDGQLGAAVAHLREALTTQDATKDAALRGEIQLVLGDIAVEQNNPAAAKAAYTDALKELAHARTQGEPEDRARVERVLSRVLDRFGALNPARKALERAYDDAPRDKQQVSATLGLIVGRALVHSDLPAARDGLRRGMAADLDQDELIYLALWVRLLERQLKAAPDGTTEKVFSSIVDDGRWSGRLAAFGGGRIRADELLSSAKTPAQKTEALFYAAMDKRVSGDAQAAEAALKQVLKQGGIDLMEVALTRDILNGARPFVSGPLPEVGLP